MPRFSEERRKQWDAYQKHSTDFWGRLETKYGTKQKRHAECRLCGDMITAHEPLDMFDVLREHEKTHIEYEEWISLGKEFSITQLSGVWHDHDCVFGKCACQCGCGSSFCVADLPEQEREKPMLCDICQLYQNRGHVEHRLEGE